jgi:hypothetical protein
MIDFAKISDGEVVSLYSQAIKELKARDIVRTNNIIGDLGEFLAIETYNQDPTLPKLVATPVGTKNIDAIGRNGHRYSIKSTTTNTTGVFYGLEEKDSEKDDERGFEYVLICKFDNNYELEMILEMDWDTFLRHKRWHSRVKAWNLVLTRQLINDSIIRYRKGQ